MKELLISFSIMLFRPLSTSDTTDSICSMVTGRFSQALTMPFSTLLRSKDSRLPSRLTTMKKTSSTFSYVVKRLPHFSHSLRRRMA